MLFANVCARSICSCYGGFWCWFGVFLGFLASSECFVHMGTAVCSGLPIMFKTWVILVCLELGTSFGELSEASSEASIHAKQQEDT